jgi:hypothetical protein
MTRATVWALGALAAWVINSVAAEDASAPRVPLVQSDTRDPDAAAVL